MTNTVTFGINKLFKGKTHVSKGFNKKMNRVRPVVFALCGVGVKECCEDHIGKGYGKVRVSVLRIQKYTYTQRLII